MEGPKKTVRYLKINVLEAALERIEHVVQSFDTIYVSYSGGKDSLVTLHLVKMVYDKLGITNPIKVIFRDEELIPDDVIEFVKKYRELPWIDMRWYAVQMASHKFVLGQTIDYVQWDENREHVRERPDFAITVPGRVFDQYTMDSFCTQDGKGKIAILTGIRADESITRFNSCVNKVNENYINGSPAGKHIKLVKPIYDWSERDVFRFMYDEGISYCPIYDKQVWNREGLRVATPVHAENAKKFDKLRTIAPTLYRQIASIMPEMLLQERYWHELDRYGIIYKYPHSWDGIAQYVRENMPDAHQRALAAKRILECKIIRQNKLKAGEGAHNFGGYPLLYVFKCIVNGQYKRAIQPLNKAGLQMFEYEGVEPPDGGK